MITKKHLFNLYLELDERIEVLEEELAKTKLESAYKKLLEKEPTAPKRGRGRPRKNA